MVHQSPLIYKTYLFALEEEISGQAVIGSIVWVFRGLNVPEDGPSAAMLFIPFALTFFLIFWVFFSHHTFLWSSFFQESWSNSRSHTISATGVLSVLLPFVHMDMDAVPTAFDRSGLGPSTALKYREKGNCSPIICQPLPFPDIVLWQSFWLFWFTGLQEALVY